MHKVNTKVTANEKYQPHFAVGTAAVGTAADASAVARGIGKRGGLNCRTIKEPRDRGLQSLSGELVG